MTHEQNLYNVLRYQDGQPLDYMLGCSCPLSVAHAAAQRYTQDHPELARRRMKHSGSSTPDWTYAAVPVDFRHPRWMQEI